MPSGEGSDRYDPTARSSLAWRAAMARRHSSSTESGSPSWSATLHPAGSAIGNQGRTPAGVNPPPSSPFQGMGVRSASRPL